MPTNSADALDSFASAPADKAGRRLFDDLVDDLSKIVDDTAALDAALSKIGEVALDGPPPRSKAFFNLLLQLPRIPSSLSRQLNFWLQNRVDKSDAERRLSLLESLAYVKPAPTFVQLDHEKIIRDRFPIAWFDLVLRAVSTEKAVEVIGALISDGKFPAKAIVARAPSFRKYTDSKFPQFLQSIINFFSASEAKELCTQLDEIYGIGLEASNSPAEYKPARLITHPKYVPILESLRRSRAGQYINGGPQ